MEKVDLNTRNVIFFDGVCHLCNGFVDAIIRRDSRHILLFAPLQGKTARQLLPPENLKNLDSVIYFEAGHIYHRSSAIIRIIARLDGAYKLINLARLIPEKIRDRIYDWIATNRYLWFGKSEVCRIPTKDERSYLLD